MKKNYLLLLLCSILAGGLDAQNSDWRQFYGNDGINYDFHIMGDSRIVFPFSGGFGIARLDAPEELRIFDALNSDIPAADIRTALAHPTEDVFWLGTNNYGLLHFANGSWSYHRTSSDGLPLASIGQMAMIDDSTIWFHSSHALSTLPDKLYQFQNGLITELPIEMNENDPVSSIKKAADGSVWVNNWRAIHRYKDGLWTTFSSADIGLGNVGALAVGGNGLVYLLGSPQSSGGPALYCFCDEQWAAIPYPADYAYYDFWLYMLDVAPDGRLWVALRNEHNALMAYDGANWSLHPLSDMGLNGRSIYQFEVDQAGRYWMRHGTSLYVYHAGALTQLKPANCAMPESRFGELGAPMSWGTTVIDVHQNKWFLNPEGLVRFDGLEWKRFLFPEGVPETAIFQFFSEDGHGNIWIFMQREDNTTTWIKFDGSNYEFIPMTNPDGMVENMSIVSSTFDAAGRIWVGTPSRIAHFNGQEWQYSPPLTSQALGIPLPDPSISLQTDADGNIWSLGLQLHRFDGVAWESLPIYTPGGLPNLFNSSIQLFSLRDNGLFLVKKEASADGHYLYRLENNAWMPFDTTGLGSVHLSQLIEDSEGVIWGRSVAGLFTYNGTNWVRTHVMNSNLPDNNISGISIDQRDNFWMMVHLNHLVVYREGGLESLLAEPLNYFSGTVYFDANDNAIIDAEDIQLPYQRVWNVTDSAYLFTGNDGRYVAFAAPGEYEIRISLLPDWEVQNNVESYTVALGETSLSGFDFLVRPTSSDFQIETEFTGGFPRCLSLAPNWIDLFNANIFPVVARLEFTYDEACGYVSASPLPDEVNGHTLIWHALELGPLESSQLEVQLLMPDEQATGDSISHLLVVEGTFAGGIEIEPDSVAYSAVVRCAYDPNDKLSASEGQQDGSYAAWDAPMTYTIRFQNTGNDTAFTVVIVDTLDNKLDLQSFELLGHSHPLRTTMSAGGVVRFIFENIELPDSTTNFAGSQGYVKYRIRGKEGPLPLQVLNTAYIYFDFNTPIVTNTVENWLIEWISSTHEPDKPQLDVRVLPNPASHRIQLVASEAFLPGTLIILCHANGQVLRSEKIAGASPNHELDLSGLPSGAYFIRIVNEQSSTTEQVIIR